MKRLSNSSSFKGLEEEDHVNLMIPISSSVEGRGKYEERFQSLLVDGVEGIEEEEEEELLSNGQSSWLGEKKRRLSTEQVKALEKYFEVENKLDPERKVRLAQEIGLQPRQVAVWFQNRRARWKTKQLERDYGALKARHESLKLDCDVLRRDKDVLLAEIRELKAKLADSTAAATAATSEPENKAAEEERPVALMHKDGASDSDSSVVFNDEASPYSGVVLEQQYGHMGIKSQCSLLSFHNKGQGEKVYMEEGFLSPDELCSSLFSEEQAPTFSWYCPEGWN